MAVQAEAATKSSRRSKNGCKTCRIRRIKCGEERPACKRCVASGWKCDGYTPSPGPPAEYAARGPSTPIDKASAQYSIVTSQSPSTVAASLSQEDNMTFSFFLHVTCPDVYRMLPTASSFLQSALQLASTRPPVLYAILTQGLAHRRMDYLVDTTMTRWYADEDQFDVYSNYARAIACLRNYLLETKDEREKVEVTLLSCMVFVCFEVGQGRGVEAEKHLRAGRRVIAEQFGAGKRLSMPAWVAEIRDGLREDGAEEVRSDRFLARGLSSGVPEIFVDAAEARAHLEVLIDSAEKLRKDFVDVAKSQVACLSNTRLEHGIASILAICTARILDRRLHGSLHQRLDVLLRTHKQWHQAFHSLLATTPLPPTQANLLLPIQHFTSHFILTTLANPAEDFITTWTDRFASILETCSTYLALPSTCVSHHDTLPNPTLSTPIPLGPQNPIPRTSLSLLPRIFPALHTIALRARGPLIRRRAIDILLSCRRQEALFFSQLVAVFDSAVLELEEREVEEGRRGGFSELMVDALPTEDGRKAAGSVVVWGGRIWRKKGCGRDGEGGGWVVEVGMWEASGLPLRTRMVWRREFEVG